MSADEAAFKLQVHPSGYQKVVLVYSGKCIAQLAILVLALQPAEQHYQNVSMMYHRKHSALSRCLHHKPLRAWGGQY